MHGKVGRKAGSRRIECGQSDVRAYIVRRSTGYLPEENFVLRAGDTLTALVTSRKTLKLEKSLLELR